MKFALVLALALVAVSAQAARTVEKETILCQGIEKSKGYSLKLAAKSQSNVENKAIAYWASLDQPNGTGYDGLIFGYKEDVMLKLKPRKNDNVQVTGTIFMDDAEQNLEYELANGKLVKLKLECSLQQ